MIYSQPTIFTTLLLTALGLHLLGGCAPKASPGRITPITPARHLQAVKACTPLLDHPSIQAAVKNYQSLGLSSGYCYGTCSPRSVVFHATGSADHEVTDFHTKETTRQKIAFSRAQFNHLAALAVHAQAARVEKPPLYITDVPTTTLEAKGTPPARWSYTFPGEDSDAITALVNCVGKERNRLFGEDP